MRSILLSFGVATVLCAPPLAHAQAAKSPHSFSANVSLYSDYRFRGLSQTLQRPAIQGGFDYSHASGIYLGNWNSNVSSTLFTNANLETDFYGGYKGSLSNDVNFDLGGIYYYYPGSKATLQNPDTGTFCTDCTVDHTEVYAGIAWKWVSLKFNYAISDYFGVPDTNGSHYTDLSGNYEFGNGFAVNAHVGYQHIRNFTNASYTDWKIGASYAIDGWTFGAAYVDTDAKDSVYTFTDSRKTMNIGKAGVLAYVSRSF